jgi:hypothetical protein
VVSGVALLTNCWKLLKIVEFVFSLVKCDVASEKGSGESKHTLDCRGAGSAFLPGHSQRRMQCDCPTHVEQARTAGIGRPP